MVGWDFLKTIEGDQDFLAKMGCSPYSKGGFYIKGDNHFLH